MLYFTNILTNFKEGIFMNKTNKFSSNKNLLNSNDRSNTIKQLEHSFIVFILKKLSHKDAPLSASAIADYMCLLTGEMHTEKTTLRKLKEICYLQCDSINPVIGNTLWLTFGGTIIEVSNEGKKNITKKQSKFYFQPLMHASDLALVCGAIASNRYLSDNEKNYLLSREMTLSNLDANPDSIIAQIDELANESLAYDYMDDISTSTNKSHSTLLQHINHLYDAIKKGYMVEIIYGVYDLHKNGNKLSFHPKNSNKPYRLNPYAMLWNSGAFYLLATHGGHSNPVHFRIDRIVSIKDIVTEDDATIKEVRAPLPDILKAFFKHNSLGEYEFSSEKYTATYPLMGIYNDTNYQDCFIECTSGTLSILIDTFGASLRIYPSHVPHRDDELDYLGRPQRFLIAGIKQVQYDNIVQFCLQQHTAVTAIYPPSLVEDVKKVLMSSADRYNKLPKEAQKQPYA